MLMQDPTEAISCITGIQHAHHLSGRHRIKSKTTKTTSERTATIELFNINCTLATALVGTIRSHILFTRSLDKRKTARKGILEFSEVVFLNEIKRTFAHLLLLLSVVFQHTSTRAVHCVKALVENLRPNYEDTVVALGFYILAYEEIGIVVGDLTEINSGKFDELSRCVPETVSNCDICSVFVPVAVSTVRALYAGTLVTCWTTAPSHRSCRSSSALLAALCLFLATLTITTRCYASTYATHQLVQFNPRNRSPIKADSNTPTHSSKIVLSRFKSSREIVQSDTRIIVTNSKILLYNQTFKIFNRRNFNAHFRTKRDFQTNPVFLNNFQTYQTYSDENSSEQTDAENNEIPRYPLNINEYKQSTPSNPKTYITKRVKLRKLTPVLNLEKRSDVPITIANVSESAWNTSANTNISEVSNTLQIVDRQSEETNEKQPPHQFPTQSMPPLNGSKDNTPVSKWGILVLVLSAVVLTVALGLVTCVLNHYRSGAGGTAAVDPHDAAQTPTTAPMLSVVSAGAAAGVGGMDRLRGRGAAARELAATRDRQVRLHTVHTDIAINLPPSIAMPDGEEHTFTSSRLHIRDSEQESEIYQKCIRPPPNRTVLESESPPPYRSSSAGLLGSIGSSSSSSSDWSGGSAPLVVRCHSMSSTSKRPEAGSSGQKTDFIQRTVKIFTGKKSQPPPAPTLPVVIVPARPRRTSDQQQSSMGRPKPSV